MPPRCWLWQSFSNLRCDTGNDTRRIYSVVCGIRITESLPLKTSKHHRKCGMLSQLAKLFSRQNGKSCLPKDSMSRRGLFCSPDCSALFLISSPQPHSKQTSSSNQMVIDSLAASLAFAVGHTFPHHRLHKEMIPVNLVSPFPSF